MSFRARALKIWTGRSLLPRSAYERWRLVPAPKRGEILFRVAQLFAERKDDLAAEMTQEMGKVRPEAAGDVQEAIDMTYYMAGEGRRLFGHTTPSELRDKFMMSTRNPVGVVGAITPWNFPIAIPSWKIAPALVCGNTVVLKPAAETSLLAERFVEIFEEAGLPPRRPEHRPRVGEDRRCPARAASRRPPDHVHGLPRGRGPGDAERGTAS